MSEEAHLLPASDHSAAIDRLILALNLIADLDQADKAAIGALPLRLVHAGASADIVDQGKQPDECCLVVEGIVCRYRRVFDGGRQILSFHLPGDIPDLQNLHLAEVDFSLCSVGPTLVAFIPHDALVNLMISNPATAKAFWRASLIDASIAREWLTGIGRRRTAQRMAHLFCEFYYRSRTLGVSNGAFTLPLTQPDLADTLGISPVHVNRMIQSLRRAQLISWNGGKFGVSDWERLRAFADFDPAYLHHIRLTPSDLAVQKGEGALLDTRGD